MIKEISCAVNPMRKRKSAVVSGKNDEKHRRISGGASAKRFAL